MLIASFPAGALAANCYLVAAASGSDCVIVDPGMDALSGIESVVAQHRLQPAAVLLTHGHFDHVGSAARVCSRFGAGCWVDDRDRDWLTKPLAALPAAMHSLITEAMDLNRLTEPEPIIQLGSSARIAGLDIELLPAPGHTPGSTLFRTPYLAGPDDPGAAGVTELVFTGDVLFAGSIGRTDLPGGDPDQMTRTLTETVLPLPDTAAVLPGHGPQTMIGRERAHNPFLRNESPPGDSSQD